MRFTRSVVVASLFAVVTGGVTVSAATTTPSFDWEVVTVTAGAGGAAGVEIIQSLVGESTDNDQVVVYGVGEPRERQSWIYSDDTPYDARDAAVSTSRQLGGIHLSLLSRTDEHWVSTGVGTWVPTMQPRETMAFLFAQAHARLRLLSLRQLVARGSLAAVHVYRGTGTDYLPLVTPDTDGTAAAAASASAGTTTRVVTLPTSIVGANVLGSSGYMRGSWTAPGGKPHPFLQYMSAAVACADHGNTLSGPAGRWSFTSEGVMQYPGTPVLAAYVPVGALLRLFPAWPAATNGSTCTEV